MSYIRLVLILLLGTTFLPGTLSAQYDRDSGEYQILAAQYGTEYHHADVTNRLKELARSDRTFVMGNRTFGVDPDPGRVKALRIYARGQDGRERMFEYREGSVVDGSLFRGWGRGDWGQGGWSGRWEGGRDAGYGGGQGGAGYGGGQYGGRYGNRDEGQYAIVGAQYGTRRHHVDVSDRLKELARHDRTFAMGNRTFGVDPDPGRVKTLRIYTRGPNGRDRMFEYREGSVIDGSQFRGWERGEWGRWNGRW
jgi:hypothetical protein